MTDISKISNLKDMSLDLDKDLKNLYKKWQAIMEIRIIIPENQELKPRIIVFGVGGAGGNAVNNMISKNLEGIDFIAGNTDAQALQQSGAAKKIQLGEF